LITAAYPAIAVPLM